MAVTRQMQGPVLVVTLDAAEVRNALDAATMAELRDLFEGIAYRDPLPPGGDAAQAGPGGLFRPHAVVLRSTGAVFCAGAHLGEMRRLGQADYQANLAAALDMGAMFRAIRNCPAPVVARVQGPAYGGGVGLAAASDLVIAAPTARFAFTEVRLGIVPGVIAPVVIERTGPSAARAAFLTAEPLGAAEARAIGLVDRVAATDADLDAAVTGAVQALLAGGPAALGLVKSLVDNVQTLGFARSAEFCGGLIAQARTGAEGQAALAAFNEKRPSPWTGAAAWTLPPEPRKDPA
ncbi:MAG TPA: enoyl-CoA hydratase-related protein [Candidatus Krumholzibacteria bacterium]|nr:enoyl-CoA hydratase-related protein [Candidatus Krumholzibacteria bacterium]